MLGDAGAPPLHVLPGLASGTRGLVPQSGLAEGQGAIYRKKAGLLGGSWGRTVCEIKHRTVWGSALTAWSLLGILSLPLPHSRMRTLSRSLTLSDFKIEKGVRVLGTELSQRGPSLGT